tara:strand:- start:675 stop:887 length:213 start_codon:yes stop_codon:yes gene_type:complete
MSSELKEIMIFAITGLTMAMVWYQVWVKPNDERMYLTIDCMNEINDHSEEAYVFCSRNAKAKQDYKNEAR